VRRRDVVGDSRHGLSDGMVRLRLMFWGQYQYDVVLLYVILPFDCSHFVC